MEFGQFVEMIKERYQPQAVILFGSRAKGEPLTTSDYDLLIVSSSFKGVPFTDRMTDIYKLWELKEDLDCLCLTPEEFERTRHMISIVREACRQGRFL